MVSSDASHLEALWQEALSDYKTTTHKDLKDLQKLHIDSSASVLDTLQSRHSAFKDFDKRRKDFTNALDSVLIPVKGLLSVASAAALLVRISFILSSQ